MINQDELFNQLNPDQFSNDIDSSQFSDSQMIDNDFYQPPDENNFRPRFHQENLAEILDERLIQHISNDVLDAIKDDLESRSEWETILEKGITQLGLKTEEKSFPFEKASSAFSGAYRESYLNLLSLLTSIFLPPEGPVKTMVEGDTNAQIDDKGNRIEKYYNYFLTRVAREYYPDTEQALGWCIIQGSVFKKSYGDPSLNRPTSLYIKPQNFIVNYGATTLQTASRLTEIIHLTNKELKIRQGLGMYRDTDVYPIDTYLMEEDDIESKVNEIIGIDNPHYDEDKLYTIYESHVNLVIEDLDENVAPHLKGLALPYIVTIDTQSEKILSIYRNWKEGDLYAKRIDYYSHFFLIPGLGIYGWGLAHLCGGDAEAATAILRQLIDAGTLSNFPGGVRMAGMRLTDNNIRVGPTEFVEIETGGKSIQEAIMPLPYKGPDAILFNLFEKREESILKTVAASNSQLADFSPNAPVWTSMMALEQTHKVQSSIVRRLHNSFTEEFRILFRLFAEYLPDTPYPFNVPGGQSVIMKSDFIDQINVIPVSDPNLSSNVQKLIVWDSILKNAAAYPDLHNTREIIKKYYEALKVPDIDSILTPPAQDVQPLDPITEVQHAITGKAIKASIEQDHEAHIAIKSKALQDPNLQQANPNTPAILQANIQEHLAFQYLIQMQQAIGFQLPPDPNQIPPEMQNEIAMAAAQVVQQQQQQQAQEAPPDPALLSAQAMMEDVKVKAQGIEERSQSNQMKNELEMAKMQNDLQLKTVELEHKMKMEEMRLEVEKYKIEAQTAQKEKELIQKEKELLFKEQEAHLKFNSNVEII